MSITINFFGGVLKLWQILLQNVSSSHSDLIYFLLKISK